MDWQKIKIQDSDSDLPSGAVPRSLDIILRNEQVEKAQPGDRVLITGTLIVVPDVFSMIKPGEKSQLTSMSKFNRRTDNISQQGVSGLRDLGIKDLNYKMVFLANNIRVNNSKLFATRQTNYSELNQNGEEEKNEYLKRLTEKDKIEIEKISNIPNLFNKMAKVIAPSIMGN